uniref:Centrosomal protein 192 n=1 Tax=Oreochromis niloticus TaxID=8128 RepID=A0A669E4Y8_ORENI
MADSFYKLEDEAFPSFLCKSLDSTSGRPTLGNVTLGSGPGLPVAASTVAKIRPESDNRWEYAVGFGQIQTFKSLESRFVHRSYFSWINLTPSRCDICDSVTHILGVWSPDDDIDVNNMPDDELELYFNKLVPPAMQRGRVEGQEIPATVRLFLLYFADFTDLYILPVPLLKRCKLKYLTLLLPSGANATHNVVYQNEEGQWVTDLAYYSSFEKEVAGKTSESAAQFETEDFVPASDAMDKIVKDQEQFEKEHQFMQVHMTASNGTFNSDSSWKLPFNSHILMRASQVSSEFMQGDESYLRLSLGQFFGQRSEALGCLGSSSDLVKRPSFGYIITSPEKREPFPLIHPSEFSNRDGSPSSDTTDLSEENGVRAAHPDSSDGPSSDSSLANQSYAIPDNNSSPLMLSISTIASAIADASISNDPSQLAAMIMELSKKSRARNRAESAKVGPAVSSTEEPTSALHVSVDCLFNNMFKGVSFSEPCIEETQCNFRPSTSPLTHSSPSQTSVPSADGYCVTYCFYKINVFNVSFWLAVLLIRLLMRFIPTFVMPVGKSHKSPSSFSILVISICLIFPAVRTCVSLSCITVPLSSSGQVVVPEELRFPHACCVGIASQTSLSLFNPSERWQQVSITVNSLAIDGEKVDSLPYQWLMVKNKTIIGPKSTEEQKVLFIPPHAGVYQCVLSVSSWPASAETEVAARANIFARRVVLVAIAENPALEVEVGKSGCLDFGDLPGGGAKSLPLKLLNRTHATVPIRLVISANATAWRCFTFSKHPVTMTSEGTQPAGHMTPVSSPSVMNHVMHANYGENPESFMVWVHFKAPQKYTASELGPADEYSARVDIEVDSPGPSRVIRSIPLRARSGTARVHAPKDLQVTKLDNEDSFSVTPNELTLRVGEEHGIVVSFKAQGNRKCRDSLLTILVLLSGPQYEVTLKGEVTPEDSGKHALPSAAVCGPGLTNNVPPILSNKQFVAWGGVTLGRAVQQKLVLRNNSTDATQQLRLLIRGQDQDCFQLQSLFSPEERLTRHGELSIRPREDVTVHLLFAPTRVACMLAKLEIKQSGVRPSQPGVKFTIPLSGYGGTSNIILEDQRKRADGYVATLTDIAVGCVSKVCLCVRNTGSRAAFIKAVAFSDVQIQSLMEPSVISLAPSQFVLKERTQEVITVLMKSTQREQNLCQLASALLATIYLFCGDEVSRQQYRRLLQSKPEVARKALSDNSLLKNIDFNEKFLGEENVAEACDLPQRPNEAHIFYGNMSKVVVSLLGSTKNTDFEESEHALLLPSAQSSSETDSGSSNGNVSLDVLPVKGPQGPALRVADEFLLLLLLLLLFLDGASTTSQVQIRNNTSRELSFDLSWPAHCLTITPQHGVIEPQCHLQILISPNPSLATKSSLLPWSGQIYVQCDGQQKFIKVQIRRDLALDVSTAPADSSLSALPPQAATPLLPVGRLTTRPSLTPQMPQAMVEINNKTIVFPTTPSGETSEAQLEVQNGNVEVRWYLSSFAPPYVKGVDNSGDVYRATYTAFRCSRVSGTLGVPITFLPRDRGDYAQFWDLECHPVSEPQQKTRIRLQLCVAHFVILSQEEAVRRGVYSPQDLYTFPATRVGESSSLKVNVRNNSSDTHELKFVNPSEPFYIKHSRYSLRSQHYLKLPVQFKPSTAGGHSGLLLIQSETSGSLVIQLTGELADEK